MALMECPECGKQVSDRAAACPHCGCPVSQVSQAGPQKRREAKPAGATPNAHARPQAAGAESRRVPPPRPRGPGSGAGGAAARSEAADTQRAWPRGRKYYFVALGALLLCAYAVAEIVAPAWGDMTLLFFVVAAFPCTVWFLLWRS